MPPFLVWVILTLAAGSFATNCTLLSYIIHKHRTQRQGINRQQQNIPTRPTTNSRYCVATRIHR